MTATTAAPAPARHVAATAANGNVYTVVIDKAVTGSWTVRLEWKHRYGTDRNMWERRGLSYEQAREQANAWWVDARNRFNGK